MPEVDDVDVVMKARRGESPRMLVLAFSRDAARVCRCSFDGVQEHAPVPGVAGARTARTR